MAAPVAALLERRGALLALRRALPGRPQRVYTARNLAHLDLLLRQHLLDAVVLGAEAVRSGAFTILSEEFGAIPIFCLAPFRSDDAGLVRRLESAGVAVLVEDLDETMFERELRRRGLSARLGNDLLPLASKLGLTDRLQQDAWNLVVRGAPGRLTTGQVAHQLEISREALSRGFAAGGAPTLKQAIDAVRLAAAGQLLGCRAYRVSDVARLLGYSSVSLLQRTARRVAGTGARGLADQNAAAIVIGATRTAEVRWG